MTKKKPAGDSAQRAEDILKLIRSRSIWHEFPERKPVENKPLPADDFQTFKKNFVEEYGNEKVKDTGMTDSEFLDYFSTGNREGYEPEYVNLTRLIGQLRKNKAK